MANCWKGQHCCNHEFCFGAVGDTQNAGGSTRQLPGGSTLAYFIVYLFHCFFQNGGYHKIWFGRRHDNTWTYVRRVMRRVVLMLELMQHPQSMT